MLKNEYTEEAVALPLRPNVEWSSGCHGHRHLEGTLLTVSAQLWPAGFGPAGAHPAARTPAAVAAVHLRMRGSEADRDFPVEDGLYAVLAERRFEAPAEEEVKRQVEEWVATACNRIVAALLPQLDSIRSGL